MGKIVDPIIDYFLQIPLSEGNILQFLSHNGFKISKVQNPDGTTNSLVFYFVSYPTKTVQFDDEGRGVENFLYQYQESLFFILDENEITFLIRTPREINGIAIKKENLSGEFPIRRVLFTGDQSGIKKGENKNHFTLNKGSNDYTCEHPVVQKIFMSFIQGKKLLDIDATIQEYKNKDLTVVNL